MKRAKMLSASAGSGKTYQLAYKYVKDVVERPEMYNAILAVTFTNKATEEMKSRILREIHILAKGDKSPYMDDLCRELNVTETIVRKQAMRARTLILHNYSRFSVLTIDKFFQRIIRAFIRELGIDLNYNIELDPTQLLERGADSLVEKIAGNEDLKMWMLAFAQERLKEGDRWDMRGDLYSLGKEIFKEGSRDRTKMKQSKKELGDIVQRASKSAEDAKADFQNIAQEAVTLMEKRHVEPVMFKGQSRSFVFKFEKYASGDMSAPTATMLKAVTDIDQWYGKDADANLRDVAAELQVKLKELCDGYHKVQRLINTASLLKENYRSFALLVDLQDMVDDICKRENIMVLGETKHILSQFVNGSNAPFIYEKVGNRYERFMIDEFQDTSVREWENMLPLLQNAMAASDKCSVLIVGDVKQSIYRWRGGDWRLLQEKASRDLGSENVDVQRLKVNYRSLDKVVKFNYKIMDSVVATDNAYLNGVLDQAKSNGDIPAKLHASLYNIVESAYNEHGQSTGRKSEHEGYAEMTLYDSTLIDSPFIQIIEDAIERGYRYRDILILVRGANDSRKVAELLFKYKEQRFTSRGEVGFNVHTADALTIENSDVANFIIAIFRLTVNGDDNVQRGIYNRFLGKSYHSKFDDAERAFIQTIAHLSPIEAFEQIVMKYNLYDRKDRIAYLQAMHEGIYSFSTSRVADIQRYLTWWDERGCNDTLSVDMTDNTIEISTVHKAKGLERDVVIIPYCKWDTAPKASLQPVIWSKASAGDVATIGEFPVTYGSAMQNSLFTADYYNELVMSHVDGVNLLYVAMTRASKELYMLVPTRLNLKGKGSDAVNNIVPLLTKAIRSVVAEPKVYKGVDGVEREVYSFGTPLPKGHLAKGESKSGNIILDSYTTHLPEVKVRYPSSRFEGDEVSLSHDLRRMGLHLHKIFEQASTIDEVKRKVDSMASHMLITDDEATRLKATIEVAMADPRAQEWFAGDWDEVMSESEIISEKRCRRPDRVMVKGRRAVVVDYKFGELESAGHSKQVADYAQLLWDMGLYDSVEGYVWYISLGKIVKV